jgi:beta-glucosidase
MRILPAKLFSSLGRFFAVLLGAILSPAFPQAADRPITGPLTDRSLSPDRRADLLMEQLTLDEKLGLVHGDAPYAGQATRQPERSLGGAGWIPGIPRVGIPDFQMTDGRSGVANIGRRGRYATALPSSLAAGATFDLDLAYAYGAVVGREVRDLGFNVSLGGTANLIVNHATGGISSAGARTPS